MDYVKSEWNAKRAAWAATAIRAFAEETVLEGARDLNFFECRDEIIGDLLCDVLHYAQQNGHDPAQLAQRGLDNFNEESTGED
jgi:hypothetical protein